MYPGKSPQVNCPRDAISQSVAFLGFVQPTRYTPLLQNMGNYFQVDFCVQENEIDCNEGHLVYVRKNQNGPITGFFQAFSSQWGTILAPNIIPTENMISVNMTYCMYLVIEPNTVDSKYAKDTYTDFMVDCELKRKYNILYESYMEESLMSYYTSKTGNWLAVSMVFTGIPIRTWYMKYMIA